MALKDKLRRSLIGLGLVGILGFSGCQPGYPKVEREPNWNLLLGVGTKAYGINNNNPTAVAAGDAMIASGAAQDGRSEVNVNIGESSVNFPRNVIRDDNDHLRPIEGYEWLHPNNPNNYEVRKKTKKIELPGIVAGVWKDVNNNVRCDKGEPFEIIKPYIHRIYTKNNSFVFFSASRTHYGLNDSSYIVYDDEDNILESYPFGPIWDDPPKKEYEIVTILLINELRGKISKLEDKEISGIRKYTIDFYKGDDSNPSDSRSIIINWDDSY